MQNAKSEMKMLVVGGIVPDSITYTTLFTHSRTNCSPEEAIELHIQPCFHPTLVFALELLDSLMKNMLSHESNRRMMGEY